eukprot:3178233-Pyramimonas_sp.AAC.1
MSEAQGSEAIGLPLLVSSQPPLSPIPPDPPSLLGLCRDDELIEFRFTDYDMPRDPSGVRVITAEEQALYACGPQTPAPSESIPLPPRSPRPDDASSPLHLTLFHFVDYDMPRNYSAFKVLSAEEQASLSGPQAGEPCHREGPCCVLSQGERQGEHSR